MSPSIPGRRRPPAGPIRNAHELEALSPRSQTTRKNVLTVLASARRDSAGIAPARRALARKGVRVSDASLHKYAGPAIERGRGGRLVPTVHDRLYRRIPFLTEEGVAYVDIRSSRQASLIGEYRNALRAYLGGDDPNGERLGRFAGKGAGGARFQTDLDTIEAWATRRELDELSQEGS